MKQNGHLKTYDLTLKTVGPVHIGTGEKALKSSYLYDKTNHIISILDSDKLIQAVIDRQRVDEFEEVTAPPTEETTPSPAEIPTER